MGHPTVDNETPFAFDMMGLGDEEGRPLLLLVVKATYAFGASGLKLADEQAPVKWSGEPWGKPGESSDKNEPETAFIKPATDVVLIGHAYAPRKGATEGMVALQVGPLKKAVRVVGERTWFQRMGSVAATKPLPFDKLPLTWERAFGGWDRTDPAKPAFEPRNPVGTSFRASPRHFEEGLKLPNLEDPAEPLREFGQKVTPVGFGFTSPHWQPRAKYAGTYDEAWNKMGLDASNSLLVDYPDNISGPLPARLAVVVDARTLQSAVAQRQKVVLLFENGDPCLPFIMGLIQEPTATPLLDALLESPPAQSRPSMEARVDGKSKATGTHRIKGGSVEINEHEGRAHQAAATLGHLRDAPR